MEDNNKKITLMESPKMDERQYIYIVRSFLLSKCVTS